MSPVQSQSSAQRSGWLERLMPVPFGIAAFLTLLTFALAAAVGTDPESGRAPDARALLRQWELGLWNRGGMVFTLQMLLILVLGHVLALTPMANALMDRSLRYCRSTASAAATVVLLSVLAAWINWGLGLILGAVFARKVGEKALREGWSLHYPLVGAAGYMGMMVWHGGLSGSAPLTVNTPDHSLINVMGVIPLSETLGSETNIFTCISLLLALPLFFFWLGKRLPPGAVRLPDFSAPGPEPGPVREGAPAPGLEPGPGSTRSPAPNSLLPHTAQDSAQQADHTQSAVPAGFSFPWRSAGRIAAALFAALILVAVGLRFAESESKGSLRFLTLDFINLALLGLGLLLHGSFSRYAEAAEKAMPGAAGIAIQFPFYFGIMGLMQDFGLVAWMAQGFVELSTAQTFPLFGLLSAGLVNFFVPSGGGQWQVQGPVLIEAARALGVPDWKAIMALSYGDQLTNMLQPFWALPLLGITGLSARDILPYTAMAMLLGLVIFAVALTLF